ncbi:MAG: nucleotide exchange factor GrpE [Bacteroidales bacterium]|nr:nucleotide exchange factor GrpE [Bacteroidales bacterium]
MSRHDKNKRDGSDSRQEELEKEKAQQEKEAAAEAPSEGKDVSEGEQTANNENSEKESQKKESMESLLEAAQKQVQDEKNKYVYLMAEFDNYRRRVSQEKLDLIDTAAKGVINELLPVVDNFERALKALEESEATDAAKTGTELIYKQLLDVLKKKGVTEIEAMGKELDTDEQEAVAQIPAPDEGQKGKVVDVIQKGYKLNGKVIRFAKVVIGI